MKTFAKIKDGVVVNIEVATDEWVAEQDDSFIFVESTTSAGIGAIWNGEIFILPKPFNSFILGADGVWKAPVPMPLEQGTWVWDEEELKWNR